MGRELARGNVRTLVLARSAADKRGMVDQPVLWRIPLCLQRTKQCLHTHCQRIYFIQTYLFCAEDLHGASGVLCQVGQTASVADEPGADNIANECSQVWRDACHLFREVCAETQAVGAE